MTQKEMVVKYIEQYGSIEPFAALSKLGVYRLSDVIFRIRKERPVEMQMKKAVGMWGKEVRYGVYTFPERKEQTNDTGRAS